MKIKNIEQIIKNIIISAVFAAVALSFSSCAVLKRAEPKFPFGVNMNSPKVEVGTFETFMIRLMSKDGLRKEDVKVEYYPREDAVSFTYRYDFVTYHQFWNRSMRLSFITAVENYKKDYEDRNLSKNARRRDRKYGSLDGYIVWYTATFTVRAMAYSEYILGYKIKGRAAWFTSTQREAYYEDEVTIGNNRRSQDITMHFTRAQAEEVAAFFDQQFLNSLAGALPEEIEAPPVQFDFY